MMTIVSKPRPELDNKLSLNISNYQVRDVLDVTSIIAAAAPPRIPVERARVTVTGPGMAGAMMVTPGVSRAWCAGVTTAASSVSTITRRTTAATCPVPCRQPPSPTHSGLEVFLYSRNQVRKDIVKVSSLSV